MAEGSLKQKEKALNWLRQTISAATIVAQGKETSPEPRDMLATRIRAFVTLFDRERVWDVGEIGDPLRTQALAVADVLERQGARQR